MVLPFPSARKLSVNYGEKRFNLLFTSYMSKYNKSTKQMHNSDLWRHGLSQFDKVSSHTIKGNQIRENQAKLITLMCLCCSEHRCHLYIWFKQYPHFSHSSTIYIRFSNSKSTKGIYMRRINRKTKAREFWSCFNIVPMDK